MAHPKHRISKQRRNKRRTHDKATVPAIAKCSNCGAAVSYTHLRAHEIVVLRYSIILYVRNAGITGVNWLLRKLLLHNIDAMIKIALDNAAPCTRGL